MAVSAKSHCEASAASLPAAAIVAGFATLAAALHVFTPLNHDAAYFIEGAAKLLDGGRFGTDIMDINPPHVWWMNAAAVWLARQVGARLEVVAALFTAAMATLSLVAADRLIAGTARLARGTFIAIAAILLLFAPGYDFGQREHWMLLLTVPYVTARSLRAQDAPLPAPAGVVIGFAACLGFCIKPHFLLVPVALELWLLARTRRPLLSVAPETIALAITGIVYVGLTLIYAPSYFTTEIPSALIGYWAYKSALPEVLFSAIMQVAPAAILASFGLWARLKGEPIPALAQAFAIAGAASLIAALLQMKPWSYHFLPAVVFFDLAALVLLLTGNLSPHARRIAALAVIAMGFAPSAAEAVRSVNGSETTNHIDQLAAMFRANPGPNRTVFGFITSPRDVFPAVVAAQAQWGAPFCCEYLIAAAVRADEAPAADRAAIRAAGLQQARIAVSAVRAKEPGVIGIATGDDMLGFDGHNFDYVGWLSEHTDFASVLARYREAGPVGPFRVFVRN